MCEQYRKNLAGLTGLNVDSSILDVTRINRKLPPPPPPPPPILRSLLSRIQAQKRVGFELLAPSVSCSIEWQVLEPKRLSTPGAGPFSARTGARPSLGVFTTVPEHPRPRSK